MPNKERITTLINFLEQLPPENWNFSNVMTCCGTCGCAYGWFPKIWPEAWKYMPNRSHPPTSKTVYPIEMDKTLGVMEPYKCIGKWLDMDFHDAYNIFFTVQPYDKDFKDVTPQDVIEELRKHV